MAAVDTDTKPFTPLEAVVNVQLLDLKTQAEKNHYHALSKALDRVVYRQEGTAAVDIYHLLKGGLDPRETPYSSLMQNIGTVCSYDRLMEDLGFIWLVEHDLLDGVNSFIAKHLRRASWPNARLETRFASARNIDALLSRAAKLFPHLARSVEVTLKPDVTKVIQPKHLMYSFGDDRALFRDYVVAFEAEFGQPLEKFVLPLSFEEAVYHPQYKTEGGEVLAQTSQESSLRFIQLDECYPPVLAIGFHHRGWKHGPFLPWEVQSIKFTNNADFSPTWGPLEEGIYGQQKPVFRQTSNYVQVVLANHGIPSDFSSALVREVRPKRDDNGLEYGERSNVFCSYQQTLEKMALIEIPGAALPRPITFYLRNLVERRWPQMTPEQLINLGSGGSGIVYRGEDAIKRVLQLSHHWTARLDN